MIQSQEKPDRHLQKSIMIWIFIIMGVSMVQCRWGRHCSLECQCQEANPQQTLLTRWISGNAMKTAVCVLHGGTHVIKMLHKLPTDTEVLTLLQSSNILKTVISRSMMGHLQKLKSIDVQGTPIKSSQLTLSDDVFQDLHKLQYLSLQRIDLSNSGKVFAKLTSLESIHAVQCKVGVIKWEMFEDLDYLKEMYLVHSGIKVLEEFSFYGTPQLRRLFLSHNDLLSIEAGAFIGLLNLEYLDLSNNKLDRLSSLTFPPLPQLQWLELKQNPIQVIFPYCFQHLNGTQRLTLGHPYQPIHLMKFSFHGLNSLIYLYVPNVDNDILTEHMFHGLQSLLHLSLQGRIIALSNKAFHGAHRVQKLVLHDCQIQKIYVDAFHGLHNLLSLDLSSNNLQYIPDAFEPLEELQELILSQNKFNFLPETLLRPLISLQALRLDANPWNCTCNVMTWDEEMVIKIPTVIPYPCPRKGDPQCSEFHTTYSEDKRLAPRCEYPIKYQGKTVIEVMELLKCNQTFDI